MVNSKLGIFIYMILLPVLINLFYWISYLTLEERNVLSIYLYFIALVLTVFLILNVLINFINLKNIYTSLIMILLIIIIFIVLLNSICCCIIFDKLTKHKLGLINIMDDINILRKSYIFNVTTSIIFNIILIIQNIKK